MIIVHGIHLTRNKYLLHYFRQLKKIRADD